MCLAADAARTITATGGADEAVRDAHLADRPRGGVRTGLRGGGPVVVVLHRGDRRSSRGGARVVITLVTTGRDELEDGDRVLRLRTVGLRGVGPLHDLAV